MFEELVVPRLEKIKQLVAYYSNNPTHFSDNYSAVLEELACYIRNFDMEKKDKIESWIHVVVKNCVNKHNERNSRMRGVLSDIPFEEYTSSSVASSYSQYMGRSLMDCISDKMRRALMKVPMYKLEPFIYSVQGYSIREIIKMEMENGNLSKPSECAIKCRIFSAKNIIYRELYGRKRPTIAQCGKSFL